MKELKERIALEVSELLQRQTQTDSRLESSLPSDIQQLISKAVNESKVADEEARGEIIRQLVLSALDKSRIAEDLLRWVNFKSVGIAFSHFYDEIVKMRAEGILLYDDPLLPDTMVRKA